MVTKGLDGLGCAGFVGALLAMPSSASFKADGVSRRTSLAALFFRLSWVFVEAGVGGTTVVAVVGVGIKDWVGVRLRRPVCRGIVSLTGNPTSEEPRYAKMDKIVK